MFSVRLLTFVSQLLLALAVLYIPYQLVLGGNLNPILMFLWIIGFAIGSALLGTLAFIAENVALIAENSYTPTPYSVAETPGEQNEKKFQWTESGF